MKLISPNSDFQHLVGWYRRTPRVHGVFTTSCIPLSTRLALDGSQKVATRVAGKTGGNEAPWF